VKLQSIVVQLKDLINCTNFHGWMKGMISYKNITDDHEAISVWKSTKPKWSKSRRGFYKICV